MNQSLCTINFEPAQSIHKSVSLVTLASGCLVQEVAREAEERERAAKAAKKARREQEAKTQALKSSPKVTPVASVAESTSHEPMDVTGTV